MEDWKFMVNIVVRQDFGLEFLAKAKPLRPRPRPRTNITDHRFMLPLVLPIA